jgi:hypothetical protein
MRFVHLLVGDIEYHPLTSPVMDRRVRRRHQNEVAELTDFGFEYLCSEGQRFPLSRLFRVFPALVSFGVRLQSTPIWIKGRFVVFGYPIPRWRLKPSFVELDGSHANFMTIFQGGTLLVSGNYNHRCREALEF